MRNNRWTPSIAADNGDQTIYLVAEDFGQSGRAWREAEFGATNLETVIQDLLSGQYRNPIQVIAVDAARHWSDDVSAEVAAELRRRCNLEAREVPSSISDFVERYEAPEQRQLSLRPI